MYMDRKMVIFATWRDVTGDRERDALICAMTGLEAREGERRGWDKAPSLWMMWLPDIDSRNVHVWLLPQIVWRRGNDNPVDDLKAVAAALPAPVADLPRMSFADAPNGLAAVAFMTESWTADMHTLTDEQRAQVQAGRRILHKAPQRRETRNVVAVDINGYGYMSSRVRGSAPDEQVHLFEPADMWLPDQQDGPGRLPRALYRLAQAARLHGWPANHKRGG